MPDSDIPEFYIDQFRVNVTPFGGAMTLELSEPHPNPGQVALAKDLVRVRMSLEHMKLMILIMKRQVQGS